MRNLKKWMLLAVMVMAVGCMTGCGNQQSESSDTGTGTDTDLLSGKHHVEMEIEGYGTISLELDADEAPITVTNFINLANDGFYDGLTFHRIINGYMMQGGDPMGNGQGGADKEIKGEFAAQGSHQSRGLVYRFHLLSFSTNGVLSCSKDQPFLLRPKPWVNRN